MGFVQEAISKYEWPVEEERLVSIIKQTIITPGYAALESA